MSSPSLQATLRQAFFLFISTPQESHLHLTPYLNSTSPSANARSPGDHSSGGAPLHQRFRREENPCTHRPLTCRTGNCIILIFEGRAPPMFSLDHSCGCRLFSSTSSSIFVSSMSLQVHPILPTLTSTLLLPLPCPFMLPTLRTFHLSLLPEYIYPLSPPVPYTPTLTRTNILWHVTFYYLSVLRDFQSLPEMLETVDIACMVNILAKQVSYVLSIYPFHERLFPFPFTWLGQHLLV